MERHQGNTGMGGWGLRPSSVGGVASELVVMGERHQAVRRNVRVGAGVMEQWSSGQSLGSWWAAGGPVVRASSVSSLMYAV